MFNPPFTPNAALFLSVAICGVYNSVTAQSKIGIENYTYYGDGANVSQMPIISYENKNHLYAQARYNYEDMQTVSLYLGRSFFKQGDFSYNLIPLAGAVTGRFNGGSLGLTTEFGYKNFFASSQSQYSFSYKNKYSNFFYTWAEAGFQPLKWLFGGISVQQTQVYNTTNQFESGLLIGFSFKKWSLPLYAFNPGSSKQYFILGINMEWQRVKTQKPKNSLAATDKFNHL
ncbi:MAG TPA: hypothetical protein VGQ09_01255 [Chitinophagaceae bacterium]|nr:hypothetical protein [Chitinophagaceae bacterium]